MARPYVLLVALGSAALADPRISETTSPVVTVSAQDLEKLSQGRALGDLLNAIPCGRNQIPTLTSAMTVRGLSTTDDKVALDCRAPDDARMVGIYRAHNQARAEFGSQPLVWDTQLAYGASLYAREMPRIGLAHSPRETRPKDVRENLLRGLRGDDGTALMRTWLNEKSMFRPGEFPNVSANGDWSSVAHYTQMVWPTTTRIGCAGFDDRRWYWVVCRYAGPGNRDGTGIAPITPADQAKFPQMDYRDYLQMKTGGGMTRLDPPFQPPNALNEAPLGDEGRHPLVGYFNQAAADHATAIGKGDLNGQADALARMHRALQELAKRARQMQNAGPESRGKAARVREIFEDLNRRYREANEASRPLPKRSDNPTERG